MKNKICIIFILLCGVVFNARGQSIDSLLQLAFDNNVELKALQLEYEAALQQGPQVSQLPDPQVGIGAPLLRPETRLGAQMLNVSASQMFPWFGTLKAKEDVVLTMAKARYEQIAVIRLEIIYQIKSAYFNVYLLQEKQDVINKNLRIFNTLEEVALAKVESGQSIASDVLRISLKIQELTKQVKILEEQKAKHVAVINELTNASPMKPLILTDKIDALVVLNYDLESYTKQISEHHPLIKQLDWKIESSKKIQAVNELGNKPSLGFGLDYGVVRARTDASPMDNGRDILVPKIMFTVPIYRKKYDAKNREEELNQSAIQLRKENIENKMLSHLQTYKADYESAILMYQLAQEQITISESAFNIIISEYSTKGNRFEELLQLRNNILKYELEKIMAVVETNIAKINIDRLTDY